MVGGIVPDSPGVNLKRVRAVKEPIEEGIVPMIEAVLKFIALMTDPLQVIPAQEHLEAVLSQTHEEKGVAILVEEMMSQRTPLSMEA